MIRWLSLFFICLIMVSCGLFKSADKSDKKNKKSKVKKEIVKKEKNESFSNETYSKKLGISLSGKENKKLIFEVVNWLGTPYKYGGCDKKGTDCSCLVRNIFQKVYGIDPGRSSMDMYNQLTKVNKNSITEGDIVVFAIGSNKPDHVGIYIKDGKFVHASTAKGVIVSNLDEKYYKQHFHSVLRIKK